MEASSIMQTKGTFENSKRQYMLLA
jgi:hypothetical protein